MVNVVPFLQNTTANGKPCVAIFLSGGGSNAEKILESAAAAGGDAPFAVAALVTDRPQTSRAREIGRRFDKPVVEHDIREFHRQRGETRISLATPEGRRIREEWTDRLRELLAPWRIDFGVLAGFVPLCNITGDFPCLNVHPGDLTYEKDGKRHLVGLHTIPIERAILEDLDHLRSSVIVAAPYTGGGDDMDSGPVLGISAPVPLDLCGESLADLRAIGEARAERRPTGGFKDRLEEVAEVNLERLKKAGDWTVLPRVVSDFAQSRFGRDAGGGLFFRVGEKWVPIETVVYEGANRELVFREMPS